MKVGKEHDRRLHGQIGGQEEEREADEPLGHDPSPIPLSSFMEIVDRLPLPVAVMAAHDSIPVHGTTVTSVAAMARDPAMLVAVLRPDSRLLPIVRAAGGFSISYFGAAQISVARQFSDRSGDEGEAQFRGVPHRLGPFGAPIITGEPAWFECRIHKEFAADEHQVICGTVVAAGTNDVPPLRRFDKNRP